MLMNGYGCRQMMAGNFVCQILTIYSLSFYSIYIMYIVCVYILKNFKFHSDDV